MKKSRLITAGALCAALAGGVASAAELPTKAPKAPRSASYASADGNSYFLYNQELRYITWEGSRGYRPDYIQPNTNPLNSRNTNPGKGSQFYMPAALVYGTRPVRDVSVELLGRWGYVDSRQSTAGQSGSYSGMIDTQVSGKVVYHGNSLFIPFFSLAANLPTGETTLLGNSRFARMDPDIVDVPTFGEGFNIGPTVGVTVPIRGNTALTVALGYTSRGSYTRDDPNTVTRTVSPSDQTTVVVRVDSTFGPLDVRAGMTYAWFTDTVLTNALGSWTIEPGDRISLTAGASYRWNAQWVTVADIGWSHQAENAQSFDPPGTTPNLPGNANSDIFRANVTQYYLAGPWTFAGNVSYMHRAGNEFSPTLVEFVPAKEKWELGGLVSYRVRQNVRLDGRISRIWTKEDARPDWLFPAVVSPLACPCAFAGTGIPEISQDAWTFSFGGVVSFDPNYPLFGQVLR